MSRFLGDLKRRFERGPALVWGQWSVYIFISLLIVACSDGAPTFAPGPMSTPAPTPVPSLTLPTMPMPTPAPTARPMPTGEPDVVVDCAVRLADELVAYGTNGWWTDQDADLWRTRYAELSPQIVRLPLVHQFLEPVNDDDDPAHVHWDGFWFDTPIPWFGRTITYSRWFEALRDLDVTLMLHVPHLAGWLSANGDLGPYSTYPPQSVEEYGEFIRAALTFLTNEMGYPAEQIMLEPVNEPDLRCGQDPAVPCFWSNWTMDDLVAVVQAARQAADTVDPAIQLVGLSTCCGGELVGRLMRDCDGAVLLNGLTYHLYERGFDQGRAVQLGRQLADWGLPVYVNEYGSPKYWSDGELGALWHAAALAQLWPAGIVPVQFAMSEFPGMHEGYNRLGLFSDWDGGWEPKPAYAVYVGFFNHLGPTVPLSTTAQAPLVVTAGWGEDGSVVVWAVNASQDDWPDVVFRVKDFGNALANADVPSVAVVTVYDILARGRSVDAFALAGTPLAFAYDLPARSVHVFVLTELHPDRQE
jgi:hypothetical protein